MREAHGATEDYHEPGLYEIRLKGHLDERWAERFEGLTFSLDSGGTTVLFGPVVDQAALYGLLRQVRDLGLPLLSVVHIGPDQGDVQPGTLHRVQKGRQSHEHQETHSLERVGSDGSRDHFRGHTANPST